MKSIIKFAVAIPGILILQFSSCKKDSPPAFNCLVTSASQFERRVDITYDNHNRPIEFKDYLDTFSIDHKLVKLTYNADDLLSYVRVYDAYGVIDSLAFEYIGSTKIKQHQYYTNGIRMVENYQRNFNLNSQGYLTSDTLYAHYLDASQLTLYEYSTYEYDKYWNVIKFDSYYYSGTGYVLDYSVSYEYCDSVIPNNSYNFVRFTCLAGREGTYEYILPHKTNLLSKESFSSTSNGSYSISHTFELDAKNYPIKEYTIHPQYHYFTTYWYQCD